MGKISILIPPKNERLLAKTIEEIFNNATGEDGPTSFPRPRERDNLIYINKSQPQGIRSALNEAAARALGCHP